MFQWLGSRHITAQCQVYSGMIKMYLDIVFRMGHLNEMHDKVQLIKYQWLLFDVLNKIVSS